MTGKAAQQHARIGITGAKHLYVSIGEILARHACFEIQRQESKNNHSLNNFDPLQILHSSHEQSRVTASNYIPKSFFFFTSNIPVRKFIPHSIHVTFSTPMPEVFLNVPEKHRNPALLKRKNAKSTQKCLNSKN